MQPPAPSSTTKTRRERIGDWIVERPLGEGGMGSVYLCHKALTRRLQAALKIMGTVHNETARARFIQEADTLAALQHPTIVRIMDVGEDPTTHELFIVMEHVAGQDLEKIRRAGPMDPHEARRLIRLAAEGLEYAHSRGIFHRDIKPANLIRRDQGGVCIVDFGVAHALDQPRLTLEDAIQGSLHYLPPEVFVGTTPNLQQRDIYGLGQTLAETLLGREIYPGGLGEVVATKLAGPILLPETIPSDLREAVRRATEPDPTRRLKTMEAFREALMEPPAPSPLPALASKTSTTPSEPPPTVRDRSRDLLQALLVLSGLVLVAILGSGVWVVWQLTSVVAPLTVPVNARVPQVDAAAQTPLRRFIHPTFSAQPTSTEIYQPLEGPPEALDRMLAGGEASLALIEITANAVRVDGADLYTFDAQGLPTGDVQALPALLKRAREAYPSGEALLLVADASAPLQAVDTVAIQAEMAGFTSLYAAVSATDLLQIPGTKSRATPVLVVQRGGTPHMVAERVAPQPMLVEGESAALLTDRSTSWGALMDTTSMLYRLGAAEVQVPSVSVPIPAVASSLAGLTVTPPKAAGGVSIEALSTEAPIATLPLRRNNGAQAVEALRTVYQHQSREHAARVLGAQRTHQRVMDCYGAPLGASTLVILNVRMDGRIDRVDVPPSAVEQSEVLARCLEEALEEERFSGHWVSTGIAVDVRMLR
ncbi:MAG: serine/threonine-protein kinase [Myxococcota bacterium]